MLMMDKTSKTPLYIQLYEQIRTDILNGIIKPGIKLRSHRKTSEDLKIGRNTVKLAYDRLQAEGFITRIPRKGYYVGSLIAERFHKTNAMNFLEAAEQPHKKVDYDFRGGKLLLSELPCRQWQKFLNKCFHDYRESLTSQGSAFGETGLRAEIQKYLHDYRNVHCTTEQIVVGAGTQFCLGIACQILKTRVQDCSVAVEEPGYDQSRITLQNNGFQILPVGLDEYGLDVDTMDATDARVVYVTPSHQFPAGMVMPMGRRAQLAEWAVRRNAYIIEDDYNFHFQYDLRPLFSLQSFCTDRVIHIGSFSDLLFPCICVSYMVVPGNLLEELHKRFAHYAPFVPSLTQKPLELFMKEGYLESHLRKTKKRQREKREALVGALKNTFGDSISISGFQVGLHLLVQPKWPADEDELIRRAYQAGVGVYPVSKYWSHPKYNKNGPVLLNYGGVALAHIPVAVNLLHQAWLEK